MRRSFALKVGVKNSSKVVVVDGSCFQPLVAPGAPEKPVFSIPEGPFSLSVGRSGENDYSIDEASVSILHARIERDSLNGGDVVDLIDCGSSNGTFVNGKKVQTIPIPGAQSSGRVKISPPLCAVIRRIRQTIFI